jgi:CheY-like chemotaxis protein
MAYYPLNAPAPGNDTLRVLLVEDSDIDRDLVRRLLMVMWPHRNELQLDFAEEGYEALEMIRANSYALMLLDWRLPGMDGGRLLSALERNGDQLPVVVLTGLEKYELPSEFDKGIAVYLHKDSLNVTSLHQAIATALSNVLRKSSSATRVPKGSSAG